ncbi:MAG: DUF4139 domain-containing protein, partial [Sphingobacteriales bacterium]|nr:DUF4139 domain-containing protein [Sphingobacteriales bacterium]
ITVKDQFPVSQHKEIEVEQLESKNAVVDQETGEVTWKLIVAPGEVKKMRISYSIKYPKGELLNLN